MPKSLENKGNHGGARHGSGRRKSSDIVPHAGTATRSPPRADLSEVFAVIQASKAEVAARRARHVRPFQLPAFPPKAMPDESLRMAMDDNSNWANGSINSLEAGAIYNNYAAEGLLFPGYTYLSELAQRPEYRILAETIPDDATRKWIKFEIAGTEDEVLDRKAEDAEDPKNADARREERVAESGLAEKVKKIEEYLEMLHARERLYDLAVGDNLFGRMHLHFNFAKDGGLESPEVLKTSVGDGSDKISRARVAPRTPLRNLKVIEPVWTYPMAYNATNPLLEDWYNPQYWYVLGQELHTSRLTPFISRPVPDILKPSYAFGGLSMTQLAEPYVNIWLRTRQSVADMIHSFSVMVLMTDLQTLMQPGGANDLLARVALFNALRDNQGAFVVNKTTEDLKNVSASLSGLDHLQAQAQEHMASVSRLPLVKLTGISPSGLNASSEGEIRVYYDTVNAYQERKIRPPLTKIINFAQLSLWGEIDNRLTYIFEPLQEMSEKEKADLQKAKAERDQIYVNGGAISAEEWRAAIINDPALPYADLNPDDVPEPPADDGLGGGEEGGGEGGPDAGSAKRQPPKEGAKQAEDLAPFGLDAEWDESLHPRAPDGKFGKGGGGSAGAKTLNPSTLTKTGEKKGSNPGGTFKDTDGTEYYIKKPPTKSHAASEVLAANLFKMTGGNTLQYHPVEGGKHVATKMEKLDADNVSKLTPAEKVKARKDFVANAWLSNWDVVGTGGDNLGVVNGKVTPLDFGGALAFRAQGTPKGEAFGDSVTELATMRDASKSPDAAALYGDMSLDDMKESAKKVTDIPNKEIIKAVQDAGGSPELAQRLLARKQYIADQYDLPTDQTAFDESKFKRNPDGTFAAQNLPDEPKMEKPGAAEEDDGAPKAGAYGGLWKTGGSGSPSDNWAMNAATYVNAKAQIGIHYRRMMTKLFGDADKFGASPELKTKLKAKLVESLTATMHGLEKKAQNADFAAAKKLYAEASKVEATIKKLGGAVVTPKPPAPAKQDDDEYDPDQAHGQFVDDIGKLNSNSGLTLPQKALGSLNLAEHHGIPLDMAMSSLPPAQQNFINASYGNAENALAAEKQKKENAKPKPPASSQTINALKDKFFANTKEKGELSPLEKGKQIIKAGAQVGAHPTDMLGLMSKENIDAITAQYGTVTAAISKANEYAASEKKQAAVTEAQAQAAKQAQIAKQTKDKALLKDPGYNALAGVVGGVSAEKYRKRGLYHQKTLKEHGVDITETEGALIASYIGSAYESMNEQLYSGAVKPEQMRYRKHLEKALEKLPVHKGKVIRGIKNITKATFMKYVPDHVVPSPAFMSAGKKEKLWGQFTLEIEGQSARDISMLNGEGGGEVIFLPHASFLVKSNNGTHAVLEEWYE